MWLILADARLIAQFATNMLKASRCQPRVCVFAEVKGGYKTEQF